MKFKKWCFVSVSLILLSFLSGCNKEHIHNLEENYETSETHHLKKCLDCGEVVINEEHHFVENGNFRICDVCNYSLSLSEEALFNKWMAGKEYSCSYEGEYSFVETVNEYKDDKVIFKASLSEGKKDNQYYYINDVDSLNDEGVLKRESHNLKAIKNIVVDGKNKTKYYIEEVDSSENRIEGSYVSPDYADSIENQKIADYFEGYFLAEYDTYSSFIEGIRKGFSEEYQREPDELKFIGNEDGSIDFLIGIVGEMVNEDLVKEVGYQKTTYDDKYYVRAENGKITGFVTDLHDTNIYDNKKEVVRYNRTLNYSYSFDKKLFDSISIETDVTENDYYGLVNFIIGGAPLRYHDDAYVDTVYTAKEAIDYLDTLIAFIISSRESNADCLALYLDEKYTIPFVEKEIENDDGLNIYVRFEMPENLTAIICIFDNGERSWVYLVYIDEAGSVFKAGTMYSEYKIKTINGEKWKEGDSTDIVCEGGKTYIIVFDTPNLMG